MSDINRSDGHSHPDAETLHPTISHAPSVVNGKRYPRSGDYEAQYFATAETPNFQALSRIGNPTALPIASFAISLSVASYSLLQWGNMQLTLAYPALGVFAFIGGLGLVLGAIMELIVGNSFAFCVFGTFGGYWLALFSVFNADYGVASTTMANAQAGDPLAMEHQFMALGYWQITFCILDFIYLICSLRTNLVFVGIFFTLWPAFGLLAAMLCTTDLTSAEARNLSIAAGSFTFVTCILGWYLVLALLAKDVGHGFALPLGDLSGFWKNREGKSNEKTA